MSSEFEVDSGDLGRGSQLERGNAPTQSRQNGPSWLQQIAASGLRTIVLYSLAILLAIAIVGGGTLGLIAVFGVQGQPPNPPSDPSAGIGASEKKKAPSSVANQTPENARETDSGGELAADYEKGEVDDYDEKRPRARRSDIEPGPYDPKYPVETAEESLIASLYWKGEKYDELLTETKKELAAWSELVTELQANELGRRVASSKDLTEQFVALCDRHEDEQRDVDQLIRSFGVSFKSVTFAAHNKHSGFSPTDGFVAEFNSLGETIEQKLNSLRLDLRTMEALLRTAKETSPGEKTLQVAVAEIQDEHARARGEQIAVEMRIVREAADREITIAEAAKLKAAKDVELQKIRDEEAASLAKRRELEIAAVHNAKAREQALKEAETERQFDAAFPRMRTYLTPFITDGYAQPGSGDQFERTVKKGPVSFGKLKGSGILDESIEGLRRFYAMVSAYGHENDRALGGFPPYGGGAQDFAAKQERLLTIQTFLRLYGDVMVKKKLLAP